LEEVNLIPGILELVKESVKLQAARRSVAGKQANHE
jgi:hypothetical protein